MKKNTIILFSIPLMFNFYFAYAGPPVSHVKMAAIEVTQGEQIYANGKMQAVVRVQAELKPDVFWDGTFRLYEFETKKTILSLGWIESTQDNGFDHNIMASKNIKEEYITPEKKFAIKYISTKNNNSHINMCFEIDTHKNGTKSTYSTCDKHGIERGTAEIFAKRPYTYYASDFKFTPKQVAFKLKSNHKTSENKPEYQNDIKGEIYGFRAAAHISRSISFKLLNKEKIIVITNEEADQNKQKILADSRKSAVRKYTFKDNNITNKHYLGYQESYLYKITGNSPMTGQKSALFQFINYNKAEGNTKEYQVERIPFYQAGNENIVNILDISYYRDTFMINEDRCWHNVNISKYSCRRYISASYRDDTEYFEYDDTTPLNESLFYKLKIQDNFGNEYSLLWHPYPISGAPHLTSLNNKK